MSKNTKSENKQNLETEKSVAIITTPEGVVSHSDNVNYVPKDMFADVEEQVEILSDKNGEIAVTSYSATNVVMDEEFSNSVNGVEVVGDEAIEKKSKIRKLGAPKDESKLNKFDLFFIKLWSYIVSMVIVISSGINFVIKAIFKRKAPDKYVRATVAVILIICVMLLFTLPFRINVSSNVATEIYGDGLIPVKQKVNNDALNYPIYKWGYANKKGKIIIEPAYDEALPFRYGVAWVRVMVKNLENTAYEKDYWQLIDKKGKPKGGLKFNADIHSIGADRPIGEFNAGVKLAWVKKEGATGLYGYINNSGKIKLQYDYNYAEDFSDGLARVKKGNAEFFIDKNGKEVSDRYDEVRAFSGELGAVKKNGLWGFVNVKGKMVIDPSYDDVSPFQSDYAAVRRGDAYGIIDKKGKAIIAALDYNDIYTLSPEFRALILALHK